MCQCDSNKAQRSHCHQCGSHWQDRPPAWGEVPVPPPPGPGFPPLVPPAPAPAPPPAAGDTPGALDPGALAALRLLAEQHPALRALLPQGGKPPKEGPSATRTLEKVGRAISEQKAVVRKAQERLDKLHAAFDQANRALEVAQSRLESLREDWQQWLTASRREVGGTPDFEEEEDGLSQASDPSAHSEISGTSRAKAPKSKAHRTKRGRFRPPADGGADLMMTDGA